MASELDVDSPAATAMIRAVLEEPRLTALVAFLEVGAGLAWATTDLSKGDAVQDRDTQVGRAFRAGVGLRMVGPWGLGWVVKLRRTWLRVRLDGRRQHRVRPVVRRGAVQLDRRQGCGRAGLDLARADYAALLVGPEVVLSQVAVPDTGPCGGVSFGFEDALPAHDLSVHLLGRAEPGTALRFEVDYDQNGTVDFEETLPSSWPEWSSAEGTIFPPPRPAPATVEPFVSRASRVFPGPDPAGAPRRVVFRVRKEGPGQAAIAQVVIWDARDW